MQNSHFNNGTFALTYLPNLAWPYDFELIFTEFGNSGAQFLKLVAMSLGRLELQVKINFSKLGTSVTKFCENKFKQIRSC